MRLADREIADYCRTLGMRQEDIAQIASLIERAQQGHRLVPQRTYRSFRFGQPI
jgi:hypothetical protein